MFVRCFFEVNVCLDEYELFARPRVAGHYRDLFPQALHQGSPKRQIWHKMATQNKHIRLYPASRGPFDKSKIISLSLNNYGQ